MKYHRMTVEIFDEMCGRNMSWCDKQILRRFQHILINQNEDEYSRGLADIRIEAVGERKTRVE